MHRYGRPFLLAAELRMSADLVDERLREDQRVAYKDNGTAPRVAMPEMSVMQRTVAHEFGDEAEQVVIHGVKQLTVIGSRLERTRYGSHAFAGVCDDVCHLLRALLLLVACHRVASYFSGFTAIFCLLNKMQKKSHYSNGVSLRALGNS